VVCMCVYMCCVRVCLYLSDCVSVFLHLRVLHVALQLPSLGERNGNWAAVCALRCPKQ